VISRAVEARTCAERERPARLETPGGAILCQMVTASVLVAAAAAATVGRPEGASFNAISDISPAFTTVLGATTARMAFAIGLTGVTLVATMVVSSTVAWAIGEVTGFRYSLEHRPSEAPWFYAAFAAGLVAGGVFVASGVSPIRPLAAGAVTALLLLYILAPEAGRDDAAARPL